MGAGLLASRTPLYGQEGPEEKSGRLTKGDAALLRFAAAEFLETDFWVQYNELGGVQDSEVPGVTGNVPYTNACAVLDNDMAVYIHDNTDDEFTHQNFLNAYRTMNLAGIFVRERGLFMFPQDKGRFYHDGPFNSLLDVVNSYNERFGLGLSEQEKNDLVEYLKSL